MGQASAAPAHAAQRQTCLRGSDIETTAAMACLRAIEVSSEVSAEISGTPRRTCTGSRRPRAAAPSRRRTRPSAFAATGGCGAPPRPQRPRGARVARRRLRRCRPASYRNSRARGRPMPAAPVESCQSPPKRSPWGRLGSVLDTCKRLRRMRRRFKHFWPISLSRPLGLAIFWPRFASRALRAH